ncbi:MULTISPECIES: RrF2 family transcriptional regulator [Acinetobacter]|jgi:Rrf2 family transcriptional regulator, nitric oxide-sensitive transcriptional repressor|uniref:RrF2 family transcriptional regulator n=1 Tax=Acinetobacter TaxID=469 RepID=UPI00066266A6|nr:MULTISPECIES: Rrf2 family transcriptional regulator [Acinetobacter]AWD69714.1 Rrf2 family transcriptional regulator [Acinetobacter schindleri]KMU99842.1 transcriptional regulator [Acinetobacter sp. VT 511]MCU4519206.1 Rrf2 family transcriptional regulator [Acinetobacter schindleri]MDP1444145.1 Rrf2 family transcriptional regulator [Acinetobacter schindleri]POU27505.1 transcriptional regulator [Acinetobacter sp. ACNIH3]
MQLNKFTDYALRILMYIAQPKEMPYTIAELANELQVSENHAMKIVHFMAKQDWLITTRGRGGGIRMNPLTLKIPLGQVVRILQQDSQVVECNTPPCVLRKNCGLKGILDDAVEQFYASLDQYTLSEVVTPLQGHYSIQSPIGLINL